MTYRTRSATLGSTLIARRAGMRQAITAVTARITLTAANVRRIDRVDPEQQALDVARRRERGDQPDRGADRHQPEAFSENQAEDRRRRGAEREPDADLGCAAARRRAP